MRLQALSSYSNLLEEMAHWTAGEAKDKPWQADFPKPLHNYLARAREQQCLPEVSKILGEHCREMQERRRNQRFANSYLTLVVFLAWCGLLFTLWNLVPILEVGVPTAFGTPWWLALLHDLRQTMVYWGGLLPVLGLSLLGLKARAFRGNEIDNLQNREGLACGLAVVLCQNRDTKKSIELACEIFRVTPSDLGLDRTWFSNEESHEELRSQLIASMLWLNARRDRSRKWWTESFPSIFSVLVTAVVLGAYFFLAVLPWLWMVHSALQQQTF